MKFNLSLEEVIGSTAKMRLLKHLLASAAPMSEGEWARILKVSNMTINRLMKEFRALNLVYSERVGNVSVWRVNKRGYLYQALLPIAKEMARFLAPRRHLINILQKGLPKTLIKKSVLFGSVARGEEQVNSDIDLFIQVADEAARTKLKSHLERLGDACLYLYGNRLAPYVLTQKEMTSKTRKSLLSQIEEGLQIYP